MTEAFPLTWPAGWPRSNHQSFGKFKTSHGNAVNGLIGELLLMRAQNVVISTNVSLNRYGLPYANKSQPADTGVAVYFTLDGVQKCFPCDKWKRVEDNIHAIELTISALRGIERWGSKNMVDAAFQGFKALPEHTAPNEEKKRYFQGMKKAEAITIFKELAKKMHPDLGGDADEFQRMKSEYDLLEA